MKYVGPKPQHGVLFVILGMIAGWFLGLLLISPMVEDEGFAEGYEVGLCTFYVGYERGLSPEEARALCDDDELRPSLLPNDINFNA